MGAGEGGAAGSGFKGVEAVLFIGAEGGLGMRAQGAAAGRAPAGLEFEFVSGAGEGTTPTSRPGIRVIRKFRVGFFGF